jgi:hypothetical protein
MATSDHEGPRNKYEAALDSEDESAIEFVLPLPEVVFHAIGHILCQWAYLEQSLNEDLLVAGPEASPPPPPDIMSRRFGARLSQWERIFKEHFKYQAARGEIAKMCKEIRDLKRLRDVVGHGTWGVGSDAVVLSTYKFGDMADLVDHDLDAKSLEQIAARISAINARLLRLREAWCRDNPQPLPPPLYEIS